MLHHIDASSFFDNKPDEAWLKKKLMKLEAWLKKKLMKLESLFIKLESCMDLAGKLQVSIFLLFSIEKFDVFCVFSLFCCFIFLFLGIVVLSSETS